MSSLQQKGPSMTTQMRALVADDDQNQRDAVRLLLMKFGFTLKTIDLATNADVARQLLAESKYDVIVSDNNMGDGNEGLRLLLDIRSRSDSTLNVETPFILHTGDDGDLVKKRAREYGGVYCYKGDNSLTQILTKVLAPKKAQAA